MRSLGAKPATSLTTSRPPALVASLVKLGLLRPIAALERPLHALWSGRATHPRPQTRLKRALGAMLSLSLSSALTHKLCW